MLRGFSSHQHCTGNIGCEDSVECRSVCVHESLKNTEAGIVYENIEMSENLERFPECPLDVRFIGHVGSDGDGIQEFRGLV